MQTDTENVSSPEYHPLFVCKPKRAKKTERKVVFMGVVQEKEGKKSSEENQKISSSKRKKGRAHKVIFLNEPQTICSVESPEKAIIPTIQLSAFLNSISEHHPQTFDIIQRGQVPGIRLPLLFN